MDDRRTLGDDTSEKVFESHPGFSECHASTLAELPNGDVVCSWFGGTKEGATDVAIWVSIRQAGRWLEPFEVARHPGVPTWNPVLFLSTGGDPAGPPAETQAHPELYLFYRVGTSPRTWSSLWMRSDDGGRTWSEALPLPDGVLGPIKNKAIVLSDGAWLSPSSVETDDGEWYCVMERSEDEGRTWTLSRKLTIDGDGAGVIQPTVWESEPGKVHALMRSKGTGKIFRSDSVDGGQNWSDPYATDLPNNNSGIDVAKLVPPSGGTKSPDPAPLALVYNPVTTGRTPLVVGVSYDNGDTWPDHVVLEDEPGEYSYPAIIPTSDGAALCYTWRRQSIKYWRLTWDHLTGKGKTNDI